MDEKLRFDKFGPDSCGSHVVDMVLEVAKVNEAKAAKDLPSAALHQEAAKAHFEAVKQVCLTQKDITQLPTDPAAQALSDKALVATHKAWKHDNTLKPFVKALQ